MEDTIPLSRTKIAQKWAVNNPKICIGIGLLIIFIGLCINLAYEHYHFFVLSIFAHLFIILGEAVMVMFFLHLFIEEQTHEKYSKMLLDLGSDSRAVLAEQADKIGKEFDGLVSDLRIQAEETVKNINDNLFAAILKDKLPHQIVDVVLASNFLNTEILRKNLKLSFTYLGKDGDNIRIAQRTEFDLEYIFGNGPAYFYFMPMSFTDTPLSSYQFKEAGYRRYLGDQLAPGGYSVFKVDVGAGISVEGDVYNLSAPVSIAKNEKIHVYQTIEIIYNIGQDGVVDNYFVKHHTVNTKIDLNHFPDELKFEVYPTFPSENFGSGKKTGTKITYEDIAFLVPGQGFGFSISKKQ